MAELQNPLYGAWFKMLPGFFRTLMPPGAVPSGVSSQASEAEAASPAPFPAGQVVKALSIMNGMLTQLYQAYLPLLAQGGLNAERLQGLATAATGSIERMRESLSMPASVWPDAGRWSAMTHLARPWDMWTAAVLTMLPSEEGSLWTGSLLGGEPGAAGTPHPLRVGIERTFGALADAFGLDPLRHVEDAWREMLSATFARQRAQMEYLLVVAEAWSKGTQRLLDGLNEMGARGERVESLLAFIRLWARGVDATMHEAMQSERALGVTAKLIRADTRHRQQLQRVVHVASEALHVPTRADMDEAYREIQELKREVRRLKKSVQRPASAGDSPSVKEIDV